MNFRILSSISLAFILNVNTSFGQLDPSTPTDVIEVGLDLLDRITATHYKGVALTVTNHTNATWRKVEGFSAATGYKDAAWEVHPSSLGTMSEDGHQQSKYFTVGGLRCHTVPGNFTKYWEATSLVLYYSPELEIYIYILVSNHFPEFGGKKNIENYFGGLRKGIIVGAGIAGKAFMDKEKRTAKWLRFHLCSEAAKGNEHQAISTSQVAIAKYGKLRVSLAAGDNCLVNIYMEQ